jgi:tetratricopeptide (TPR) repeat protein
LSKKITKHEAKTKDIMTQELQKGFTWSVKHSKLVLGSLGLFILGGVAYSGITFLNHKKETQVQELFYKAEKEYLVQKDKFEVANKPEVDATAGKKKPEKAAAVATPKPEKATGDLEKDYGPTVKSFASVIDQSPGSRAARMSALMLSEIYSQYGQKDKGIEALKKVQYQSDLLSVLIQDRVAGMQADQGDCKTAIETWDKLLAKKETGFMAGEVKLKKGLCYESLKDFTQAQAMYTQAKESGDANSPVVRRAEKYLRLLPATNTSSN